MNGLYKITSERKNNQNKLSKSELISVYYHDYFDYPLTFSDLIKWSVSEKYKDFDQSIKVVCKNDCCYISGREGLVYKKTLRKRTSENKMKIARKAAKILSILPSIKMVAVTGSLAMNNSDDDSDIDLMIITKRGLLWTTRLLSYLVLRIMNLAVRKPRNKVQKDKLCLNMWLDESDLVWRNPRNIYTSHEIAQIIPLVNKEKIYERFLYRNRWILDYWPNSIRISNLESRIWREKKSRFNILNSIFAAVEKISYKIQYRHMKSKITCEIVTKTRAIFHPHDLGKTVLHKLSS